MKKIYLVGAMCAYLFAGCAGNASQAGHDEHNHELEAHDHDHEGHEHEGHDHEHEPVVPIPARLSLRSFSRGRWFADCNG